MMLADVGSEGGVGGGGVLGGYGALGGSQTWTSGGLLNPPAGMNPSALRAVAQLSVLMQSRAIAQQQASANFNRAIVMSHVATGTPHAVVQTNVPPTLTRLAIAAGQVASQIVQQRRAGRAAARLHREQSAIAAQMRRQISRAPVATYQDIALTGLNMGPPIPGATYY